MTIRAWRSSFSSLLLLFLACSRRHQFLVLESVPLLTFRPHWQKIGQVTEADQIALFSLLLLELNVHTSIESSLSPQMIEINVTQLEANRVVSLASIFILLFNSCELGPLDEVGHVIAES